MCYVRGFIGFLFLHLHFEILVISVAESEGRLHFSDFFEHSDPPFVTARNEESPYFSSIFYR